MTMLDRRLREFRIRYLHINARLLLVFEMKNNP